MKDPAFLFYSKEFYEGTRLMFPEERACYIDLMIYQHQNGPIPDDSKRVLMYCSGINEATLQAVLQAKFKRTEKGWVNLKLQTVIDDRQGYVDKQSFNGRVGQFWKKAKLLLTSPEYNKLKKFMVGTSNEKLIKFIENNEINKAVLEAMLEAMHKGSAKHTTITNSNIDLNIFFEDRGMGEDGETQPEIETENVKTWRTDFETYKKELWSWFDGIIRDKVWLAEQEKFNPNFDILLTIEKSIKNYWITEAGWKNKKSRKSENLDWKSTFAKTMDINKVYKARAQETKEPPMPKLNLLT